MISELYLFQYAFQSDINFFLSLSFCLSFFLLDHCFCFYQIKGRYGPDLDSLAGGPSGHLVGIMVDDEARLHLLVNGVDQGVAAKEIPPNPYVVLDLYGQCQEVGFLFLFFIVVHCIVMAFCQSEGEVHLMYLCNGHDYICVKETNFLVIY